MLLQSVDNSLCVVDVEKVRVQDGLNNSCNDCNGIVKARHIEEVAIDPIGNIQRPVCAERKEVVGRDCFRFARSLQHKQLRENGNRLQPDGECPKDLSLLLVHPNCWMPELPTSEKVYLYGKSIASTALAPSKYCTLNVSRFGSWVGLKSLSMRYTVYADVLMKTILKTVL